MKRLLFIAGFVFLATTAGADTYIDDYPLLGTPATATDYMFVVDSSTAAGGARLLFNADSSKVLAGDATWIDIALTLTELSDVTITTPSSGQGLTYNGAGWVNGPIATTTTDLTGTADRVLYVDSSGDVQEVTLGNAGTYLGSNGSTSAPSFQTPSGAGDISGVGDATSGHALDGTSDGGTYIRLYDGNSNYTEVQSSDVSATTTFTLPATSGTGALNNQLLDNFGTPEDNTDLNATTSYHGLLPKLGGGTTNFLRADGTWNNPSTSADVTGVGDCAGDDCFDGTSGQGTYLNFYGTGLGNYTQLLGGNPGSNITLTLPTTEGTTGYVLQTDGSGVMSWEPPGSGTAYENISDPATNGSISFGASTGTYTSATDGWDGLIFSNTIATLTSESALLTTEFNHNSLGDPNAVFFEGISDADGSPVSLFRMDGDGLKVGEGTPTNTMDGNDLFVTDDAEVAGDLAAGSFSLVREAGQESMYQYWYEDPDEAGDNYIKVRAPTAITASTGVIAWPEESGTVITSGTDVVDFGGSSSFEIPNATGPTVNATGEIAVDTDVITQGQVVVYGASALNYVVATTDTPADNEIPKYDSSSGTITWETDAGSAAGDSVSIDGSAVVDPDFVSTGDIDFTDTSNTITADINSDSIVNADINSSAAIALSKTALVAGTNITLATNTLNVDDAFLANDGDEGTGTYDFGGAVLEIPNSNTDPAAIGNLILDTTVTNFTNGALRFHDGSNIRHSVSMVAATAEGCNDEYVVAYDADTDLFYCKADSTGSGSLGSNLSSSTTDITTDASVIQLVASNSNAEDLDIDLASTSNVVDFSSDTGVTRVDFTGMDVTIGGDDLFMATNTDTYILVADGTNFNPVDMTGDVAIANTGATTIQANSVDASMLSTQYAYSEIPVAWMKDGTTAPAALDDASTRSPYAYRDFDDGADEDLDFIWFVPADFDTVTTAIQYRVYYLITNATGPVSDDVSFALKGASAGDNDPSNPTAGTAVNITSTNLTSIQHDVMVTAWSGDVTITNIAAGEVVEMNFYRDVSEETSDPYAQDVGVFMIQLRYVQNPGS